MPLSTFLDGRDPIQLRGLAWLALSDTCVTQSAGGTSDAGGGITDVWSSGGTFACRIDPAIGGAGGDLTGGRIDERTTHVVTAPAGVSMNAGQRVVVASAGTFEITAVHQRTRDWSQTFEVIQI
jgi:hypothetical protein